MHKHLNAAGRHERLFELIRQRNLAEAACAAQHPAARPDPAEAQLFIARAHRSFMPGGAPEQAFRFAV